MRGTKRTSEEADADASVPALATRSKRTKGAAVAEGKEDVFLGQQSSSGASRGEQAAQARPKTLLTCHQFPIPTLQTFLPS